MILYNKLIRDKIPQIIEAGGKKAHVRVLDNEEYKKMLDAKLQEELNEYTAAEEKDQVEELADLVELVYGILESRDVSVEEFEYLRLSKKKERGGFKDRLFLESVTTESSNDSDNLKDKAMLLVEHVRSLSNFNIETEIDGSYEHMGATIMDAVLQAGLKYETVVKPKVLRFKNEYPEANTTSGFLSVMKQKPAGDLLQNQNGESFKGDKPLRIYEIALFFHREGIETESDLKLWLESDINLLKLKQLKGVGDKTIDYFKILVGIETSAIDRHLLNFVKEAGIVALNYKDCQDIINKTADILGVNKASFDHSIWKYMSEKKGTI